MKINSIYFKNYKRFYNGLGVTSQSFTFDPDKKIVRIIGSNGSGKSTLLSALSPLPDSPQDIIDGEDGLKEIIISEGDITYTIRYIYDRNHSSRAEILKQGIYDTQAVNLNPSGNITSAKQTIFNIFGLDANYEALTLMSGYGKKSLALLRPAERKAFVASLLNNLDTYNNIFKTLSKRSSIFKSMINSITGKIDAIGKTPDVLSLQLNSLLNEIDTLKKEKETLICDISKINLSKIQLAENEEKKKRKKELESLISKIEFDLKTLVNKFEMLIKKDGIEVEDSIHPRSSNFYHDKVVEANAKLHDITSKINDLRNSINNYNNQCNTYRNTISLIKLSKEYQDILKYTSPEHKEKFNTSKQIMDDLITKYGNLLDISIDDSIYISLTQMKALVLKIDKLNDINIDMGIKETIDEVFKINNSYNFDKVIEFKHSQYEILINNINNSEDDIAKEIIMKLDNIDAVIMNFDKYCLINEYINDINNIYDTLRKEDRDVLSSYSIKKGTIPRIADIDRALTFYDDYKLYWINKNFVQETYQFYENKTTYDKMEDELKYYNEKIDEITKTYTEEIEQSEKYMAIKNKYIDIAETYEKINKTVIEYIALVDQKLILESELKRISDSIIDTHGLEEMNNKLENLNMIIKSKEEDFYHTRYSMDLIIEYAKELTQYNNKYEFIETIKKYCSPSTGIQMVFVDLYMNKILAIANSLLQNFFGGEFVLQPFIINESEFRIPVQGNGLLIDDISSMSASQIAMINMCVSFAILSHSSSKYRIIRLDEIDSALDSNNRSRYPMIIDSVMDILGSEQCFLVSHNNEFVDTDFQIINLK